MRTAGPTTSAGWPRLQPGATRAQIPGTAALAGSDCLPRSISPQLTEIHDPNAARDLIPDAPRQRVLPEIPLHTRLPVVDHVEPERGGKLIGMVERQRVVFLVFPSQGSCFAICHLAAVTTGAKPYTSTRFATNVPFG